MRWRRHNPGSVVVRVAAVLAFGAPTVCRAQLGTDEAACHRSWGAPLSVLDPSNGTRTVRFKSKDMSVEIVFLNGTARYAKYLKPDMDDADIQRLLAANNEGRAWFPWGRRRRGVTPEAGSRWIRSDEMATAERLGPEIVFSTGEWNRREEDVPTDHSSASAPTAPITAAASPKVEDSMSDIVGHWLMGSAEKPVAALHLLGDGAFAWHAFAEGERREWLIRWGHSPSNEPASFDLWAEGEGGGTTTRVGVIRFDPPNRLRVECGEATNAMPSFVRARLTGEELVFVRVAGPPVLKADGPVEPREPKVSRPADMPAVGTPRADVLRILGKPAGRVSSGGREVLTYPWGKVWIHDGKVAKIE